jgi:hypothetical protein
MLPAQPRRHGWIGGSQSSSGKQQLGVAWSSHWRVTSFWPCAYVIQKALGGGASGMRHRDFASRAKPALRGSGAVAERKRSKGDPE